MINARMINAQHPKNVGAIIQLLKRGQAHLKKQEEWFDNELKD
jgi:hypothetical protein